VSIQQFSLKMTHKNNIQEFARSIQNSVAKHTAGIYIVWALKILGTAYRTYYVVQTVRCVGMIRKLEDKVRIH
jgi:membrane-bound inhibitor of C-type lysozyme